MPRYRSRSFSERSRGTQPSSLWLLCSGMAQVLQIDRAVFDDAPMLASVAEPVAFPPMPVAESQRVGSLPPWYLTPVALIPLAAAAFIVGNLLMMIPWSV